MAIHLAVISEHTPVTADKVLEYIGCIEQFSGAKGFAARTDSIDWLEKPVQYAKYFHVADPVHTSDHFHVIFLDAPLEDVGPEVDRYGRLAQEALAYFLKQAPIRGEPETYRVGSGAIVTHWKADLSHWSNQVSQLRRQEMAVVSAKPKQQPRRALRIEGTDVVLELSKVTMVKLDKEMFHLDKLPDGTWRLVYSEKTIPDITQVKGLTFIREDGDE